jgi:hypothetical protein
MAYMGTMLVKVPTQYPGQTFPPGKAPTLSPYKPFPPDLLPTKTPYLTPGPGYTYPTVGNKSGLNV